jgi:hypothetical protein
MNRTKMWYSIAAVAVSIMAMLVLNIVYTNHVGNAAVKASQHAIEVSQRQLCTVLVPVNEIYKRATTDTGKALAAQFQMLVKAYHCEEGR